MRHHISEIVKKKLKYPNNFKKLKYPYQGHPRQKDMKFKKITRQIQTRGTLDKKT